MNKSKNLDARTSEANDSGSNEEETRQLVGCQQETGKHQYKIKSFGISLE